MRRLALLSAAATLLAAGTASADTTHANIERAHGHYWVFFSIDHECGQAIEGPCPWFAEATVYPLTKLCPNAAGLRNLFYIGKVWRYPFRLEDGDRLPRMNTHRLTVCLYVDEGGIEEEVGEYHFRVARFPR